jgi:ComF family protein
MFTSFLHLIYPRLCLACAEPLLLVEKKICTSCISRLPRPGLFLPKPNWLSNKFGGLIDYQDVHSFFIFSEGAKVQHLMHQIKYKGQKELGIFLGEWCGNELGKYQDVCSYDLIIPIPLHEKRLKSRGYNQAACIAEGISNRTNIPMEQNVLLKNTLSKSLISQSRQDRFETLDAVFEIQNPHLIEGNHVLLVDDTLTTGATLISAGEKLLEAGASQISFLALAALK